MVVVRKTPMGGACVEAYLPGSTSEVEDKINLLRIVKFGSAALLDEDQGQIEFEFDE